MAEQEDKNENMFTNAVNGKSAKEITFYFFSAIEKTPTKQEIKIAMIQSKRMLLTYTQDVIIYAIDKYKDRMYSLGYLNQEVLNKASYECQHQLDIEISTFDKENTRGEENCGERNRDKLDREKLQGLSSQPGFRTKHNFDMLKESGQDT